MESLVPSVGQLLPRRQNNDVLHHALVFVVQDMAMQYELSNERIVACPYFDLVVLLHEKSVAENS